MGTFAMSKYNAIFASAFGVFLFSLNFRVVFMDLLDDVQWWQVLLLCLYIFCIIMVIREPVTELAPMTEEELADHEYDRILVGDEVQSEQSEALAGGKAAGNAIN